MTEDEAKTKMCPFGSTFEMFSGAVKHGGMGPCIASGCMMWRWSYPPDEAKGNKNGPMGYCGLAGKPA